MLKDNEDVSSTTKKLQRYLEIKYNNAIYETLLVTNSGGSKDHADKESSFLYFSFLKVH